MSPAQLCLSGGREQRLSDDGGSYRLSAISCCYDISSLILFLTSYYRFLA